MLRFAASAGRALEHECTLLLVFSSLERAIFSRWSNLTPVINETTCAIAVAPNRTGFGFVHVSHGRRQAVYQK